MHFKDGISEYVVSIRSWNFNFGALVFFVRRNYFIFIPPRPFIIRRLLPRHLIHFGRTEIYSRNTDVSCCGCGMRSFSCLFPLVCWRQSIWIISLYCWFSFTHIWRKISWIFFHSELSAQWSNWSFHMLTWGVWEGRLSGSLPLQRTEDFFNCSDCLPIATSLVFPLSGAHKMRFDWR